MNIFVKKKLFDVTFNLFLLCILTYLIVFWCPRRFVLHFVDIFLLFFIILIKILFGCLYNCQKKKKLHKLKKKTYIEQLFLKLSKNYKFTDFFVVIFF